MARGRTWITYIPGWPQAIGGPGGLSLVWYCTHQFAASIGAFTVAVPLPCPMLSARMVASGNKIGPEQEPPWMWPACAESGARPLKVTVTVVVSPACDSVASPDTPEPACGLSIARMPVAPAPTTGDGGVGAGMPAPLLAKAASMRCIAVAVCGSLESR